jgi:CHAT domain-containing protein
LRDVTSGQLAADYDARLRESVTGRDDVSGPLGRSLLAGLARFAIDDPGATPFSHPYYWAAFAAYGA